MIHGGEGGTLDENQRSGALEWGHTTVQLRGRRCRCGSIGCLEAYAGAEAMRERWQEAGGPLPADADDETALAALLTAAFPPPGGPAPDPVAVALLDETAECLGAAVADLINLFLPERVLLGGWAGLLIGPHLLPDIRRYAREYALRHTGARATVEMGRLGPDAVTVGAATLPLTDFLSAVAPPLAPGGPGAGATALVPHLGGAPSVTAGGRCPQSPDGLDDSARPAFEDDAGLVGPASCVGGCAAVAGVRLSSPSALSSPSGV